MAAVRVELLGTAVDLDQVSVARGAGRAAFFCRGVDLEIGQTHKTPVGGRECRDVYKQNTKTQGGKRELIEQNTGHSSSSSNRNSNRKGLLTDWQLLLTNPC
jgi:hypothetical protein